MTRHWCRFAVLCALLLAATTVANIAAGTSHAIAATPKVVLSPTSGFVGRTLTASFSGFPKNRAVTIAWDGKTVATPTSSAVGDGSTSFTIPKAKKGSHKVTATVGRISASATFTVRPSIFASPSGGTVGRAVNVTLRGYGKGESVAVAWDSTSKKLATVVASASGSADVQVTIPPTPGGQHKLIGAGNTGSQSSMSFRVVPSIRLSPSRGPAETSVRVALRGYQAGEQVEIQWRVDGGTQGLRVVTVGASTGSANVTVTVPKGSKPGSYAIVGVGYRVSFAEAPFQVT
ncbi:MAG: hypothetical protein QOF01_399 [Thermomicrobiales bacterium]|jgi:hypothetical protein|nr:hypothetical protein [Thermomicrobiales bacterium]